VQPECLALSLSVDPSNKNHVASTPGTSNHLDDAVRSIPIIHRGHGFLESVSRCISVSASACLRSLRKLQDGGSLAAR
jgi:hypothetical protein